LYRPYITHKLHRMLGRNYKGFEAVIHYIVPLIAIKAKVNFSDRIYYMNIPKKRLVIVGSGFAGIELARNMKTLVRRGIYEVTLISIHGYFEYYPGVYRIMIGETPIQTRIRLDQMLPSSINIIEDTIVKIDPVTKQIYGVGGDSYKYDELVLALGSVPNYFNVEGLQSGAFNFRTTGDAVTLRNHLHELLIKTRTEDLNNEKVMHNLHIIIGGGGPIGVELAGALSSYMRNMARVNKISASRVTIDLIDSGERLLPKVPKDGSMKIAKFLGKRGVNVFLNRAIKKIEQETVILEDATLNAKTIVWTGGVMPNPLYGAVPNFECVKGRVNVDEYLQAKNCIDVYIAGDGANTERAGLAQTAMHDGKYLARLFKAKGLSRSWPKYKQAKTGYVIPIGSNWALMVWGQFVWAGLVPGIIRYFIDVEFFLKRLSLAKFLDLYWEGFKYRRHRYIELPIETSEKTKNNLQSGLPGGASAQSGRAITYIVGFLAIIFLGIVGLGYINNKIGGDSITPVTAGTLFK
jgi:NADH:ubiquinone reductase (H+-translocating)